MRHIYWEQSINPIEPRIVVFIFPYLERLTKIYENNVNIKRISDLSADEGGECYAITNEIF